VILRRSLMSVPSWRNFARSVHDDDPPATGVSVGQVCEEAAHTVAIAFQACCTTTSPVLCFIGVSDGGAYRVTALPIIGGGKLEVYRSSPVKLQLWDETSDEMCDGCPQRYEVSEYRVVGGKPVFVRRFTPSRRYAAGEFDPDRIALMPASH
jgi:hypothetical protein